MCLLVAPNGARSTNPLLGKPFLNLWNLHESIPKLLYHINVAQRQHRNPIVATERSGDADRGSLCHASLRGYRRWNSGLPNVV